MSTESTESTSQPIRHSSHYVESNSAIFLVEDRLFRIPVYMFTSTSPIFQEMFSLPPGPGQEVEGQSDKSPIRLDQVALVDFERLVQFLYPMCQEPEWELCIDKWHSIFRLAKKWEMTEVRDRAIRRLEQIGIHHRPAWQVKYGREYDHEPWIYQGLCTLISREEGLLEKESEPLGCGDTNRCWQAWVLMSRHRRSGYKVSHKIDSVIQEIFGREYPILGSTGSDLEELKRALPSPSPASDLADSLSDNDRHLKKRLKIV